MTERPWQLRVTAGRSMPNCQERSATNGPVCSPDSPAPIESMKTKRAGPAASTASVISPTSEVTVSSRASSIAAHLAVGEGRYRRTLERHVIETAGVAAQGTIQLDADFLAQVVGRDTGLAGAGPAVRAEAEAEEEAGRLAEWVGRPLVMEPVVEGHVADRLGHDGVHPGAGELGRGRPDVSANIGVCRAEIGQEAIAERVLDSGIGVALAESEVVQVDRPRAHGEIARAAHRKQAAQWIDLLEHTGEVRLDALPAECSRIGAKEERSSIQKPNPVYGVVWMNVARVVIDRRQLDGLEAATVARDIGHGLEPLVDEITRKDHQGGLHRDPSLRAPSGS